MKSRKVLLLMAVLTAMTVSVCGCGQKDETPENGTEIAAITETEQPTEDVSEETEDTEELQIEAAVTDTEEIATSQLDSSIKEMSATKYAKSTVNVRKGPSADTEKLGGLSTNQKVTVTGQAANGWYRIDYNGEAGYVSDKYLVDEKVTAASGNSNGNKTGSNSGAAETTTASGNGSAAQENAGTQAAGQTSAGNTASGNDGGSSNNAGNSGSATSNGSGLTPDQQAAQERNEEMKKQDEEFEYDYVLSSDGFEPATDGYGDGAVITIQPTP